MEEGDDGGVLIVVALLLTFIGRAQRTIVDPEAKNLAKTTVKYISSILVDVSAKIVRER